MIDRQNNQLVVECDTCSETLETGTPDFTQAWEKAKEEGWKAHKIGNTWEHVCPDCQGGI